MTEQTDTTPFRRLWVASAWAFVVAAAAGALFRWGMVGSFPFGLDAGDIRHGHSHLMLMGWATPALMALMATRWPREGGRRNTRGVRIAGWASWALAAASFLPFVLWGYDSVPIGGADLPVAAILSGLAIFAWYGFAAVYLWAMRGVERTAASRLWDLAVAALVVSSLGAWAVAGLMIAGVDSLLWEAVTVHFFVDLFGGGWLLLGTFGVLRSQLELRDATNERVGRVMAAGGALFVFLAGLPRGETPEPWLLAGGVAAGGMAAGLVLLTQRVWPRARRWQRWAVVLLGVTAAMLAAVAVPPVAEWGIRAGLRLVYLHVAFAGFVTLGLVAAATRMWGRRAVGSPHAWLTGVLVLLVTMLPLTGLWPRQLAGAWTFQAAFAGAVAATAAVAVGCIVSHVVRSGHSTSESPG